MGLKTVIRSIPEPEFVTAEISDSTTAYGWKCSDKNIIVFGDTKQEAKDNYKKAWESEFNQKFYQ